MLTVPVMAAPDTALALTFLEALTDDEAADLRSRAIPRRFRRGAPLMNQGEAPGRVLVIEKGRAKITAVTDDGREMVLAFGGPGDLLGELSALGGSPRVATVRALEPISALALASGEFEAFLEESAAGIRITLPISQEELAGWAGASREATTKALHDLRAVGLIETRRRHIVVLDREQLSQVAGLGAHS
jgi:CRP/FNR family transcriptional regulator, cyclic AMP receptor protein